MEFSGRPGENFENPLDSIIIDKGSLIQGNLHLTPQQNTRPTVKSEENFVQRKTKHLAP